MPWYTTLLSGRRLRWMERRRLRYARVEVQIGSIHWLSMHASCSSELPMCKDCNGQSMADGSSNGVCIGGQLESCPCKSECPVTPQACDDPECHGVNDKKSGFGQCLQGRNAGCACKGICPASPPSCDDKECNGLNGAGGKEGKCKSGKFAGCGCASVCGKIDQQVCGDAIPGCVPLLASRGPGTCMDGPYWGCSCVSNCPAPAVSRSDPNCNGSVVGSCLAGKLLGCDCDSTK